MPAYASTPKASQVSALAPTTATKAPGTAQASRLLLKIFNDDQAASIYYGDSAVTDAKGIPIPPGGESVWIPCSGDIYVYSVAGGSTVRTLELA
jgi:hypothetical protein